MLSKLFKFFRGHGSRTTLARQLSTKPKAKLKDEVGERDLSENITDVQEKVRFPNGVKQPRVVIIGAGMAGLSAANRLLSSGFTDVRVVEANSKPGGRIRTCQLEGSTIELGCPHISGASVANSLYTLAAREGAIKSPLERLKKWEGLYFTSDGRAISPVLVGKALKLYKCILERAVEVHNSKLESKHESLGGYLDEAFSSELARIPETERYDMARLVYGMFNELRVGMGVDLGEVSLKSFGATREVQGGEVVVPGGMECLVESLSKGLPQNWLVLSKRVKLVRWGAAEREGPRALLKCTDGDELEADYVLVTVSLGVLKNSSDTLFCPALPSLKTEALRNLGYGSRERMFLRFERPFWAERGLALHLSWSPEEMEGGGGEGWRRGVGSLREAPGASGVLVVEVGGPEARLMEHSSEEEAVEGVACLLRKFLDDPTLPWPDQAVFSSWSLDPLFQGSSSFMALPSSLKDVQAVASPLPAHPCDDLPPILLFAGEHTHLSHFGTLQGARQSGLREADRILSLVRKYGFVTESSKCLYT